MAVTTSYNTMHHLRTWWMFFFAFVYDSHYTSPYSLMFCDLFFGSCGGRMMRVRKRSQSELAFIVSKSWIPLLGSS